MTVLAERNKIIELPVLSISVDMMEKNDFRMNVISAIGALSLKYFPSVILIRARLLGAERKLIPCGYAAYVGAKSSPSLVRDFPLWDIKFSTAFIALSYFSSLLGSARTGIGTKCPFAAPPINEHLSAVLTHVLDMRLTWSTRMPTNIPRAKSLRNFTASACARYIPHTVTIH